MPEVVHEYRPRGAAATVLECRAGEVVMSGPAGTGKSRACLEKVHLMCLLNPGMRALLIRKTHNSLTSTGLVTWREKVVPEALAARIVRYYGGSSEQPPQYQYRNGSAVMLGGMDNPLKVMSSEYDLIWVQEATELTETDWEALTTRLRNGRVSFQQLLADCNPDAPNHWLKVRADQRRTLMLESRHEDNPLLYDDAGELTERGADYMGKLDALTGVRHARLRKGLWAAAEGIVYEEWDPLVHLVDRFDIPESWVRWWTVDFGFTNPFALQCWAEDPDGRLYLYREIYRTQHLVEDHAAHILSLVRRPAEHIVAAGREPDPRQSAHWVWTEPRPRAVICDHDAEDRATLERHLGLSTSPAEKTVSDGIQAVAARLRRAADGRPRLVMLRDSLVERDQQLVDRKRPTCAAEEILGYVWDTGPKTAAGAGKPPKETPAKVDDHGMDAMRYMVAQLDLGSRPRIRWM